MQVVFEDFSIVRQLKRIIVDRLSLRTYLFWRTLVTRGSPIKTRETKKPQKNVEVEVTSSLHPHQSRRSIKSYEIKTRD